MTGAEENVAAARQLVAKLTYAKDEVARRGWLKSWGQRFQGALGRKQPAKQPVPHDEEA